MTVRVAAALAVLLAVVMLAACGGHQHPASAGDRTTEQTDHNGDDIVFARNMVPHHEQAVEMAQMVPTNTTNQQIIALANGVIRTQVPETQAFRVWLMQWQDAQGNDPGVHGGMPMTGMVDQRTMDRLRSLTGAAFDHLWLTSMVDHHRGAIAMAQDEVAHGKNPDVIYLAQRIIAGQQAEIDQMTRLLGG
jgi:uncharacterized protein (DUF305 family)